MKTLEYKALAGPIVTVKIADPASTTNGGKTGLTSASSGLIIAIRPDNSATTTAYTSAGTTIDTITTLGTYTAPSAGHCRFKEIDATNHPGHYELQFAAGLWATAGARKLVGTILVTGGAQTDFEVQLTGADVGAVAGAAGSLLQFGTSTGQIAPDGTTGGVKLAAAGLDAVVIETGLNARQALSIIAAESAGVLAGAVSTSITFAGAGVVTNRITATVDSSGDRTAVALNPPA
jgi:hypothetical protein